MNNTQLSIESRSFAEITILDCSGRIVIGEETNLLFDVVTNEMEKIPRILLNLSGVSAIDSGGLGMIVLLHRYAINSHRELKLCNPSPLVLEAFGLTALDKVLDLHLREEQAIDHFFRDVA